MINSSLEYINNDKVKILLACILIDHYCRWIIIVLPATGKFKARTHGEILLAKELENGAQILAAAPCRGTLKYEIK